LIFQLIHRKKANIFRKEEIKLIFEGMKREGFTKRGCVWREGFFALLPPLKGLILAENVSISSKCAL